MRTKYRVIAYFLIYVVVVYGGLAILLKSSIATKAIERWVVHQAKQSGVQLSLNGLTLSLVDVSVDLKSIQFRHAILGIGGELQKVRIVLRPLYLFSGVLGLDEVSVGGGSVDYKITTRPTVNPESRTPLEILQTIVGALQQSREIQYHELSIGPLALTFDTPEFKGSCAWNSTTGRRGFGGAVSLLFDIGDCPIQKTNSTAIEKENPIKHADGEFTLSSDGLLVKAIHIQSPLWNVHATGDISAKGQMSVQVNVTQTDANRREGFKEFSLDHAFIQLNLGGTLHTPTWRVSLTGHDVRYKKQLVLSKLVAVGERDGKVIKVSRAEFHKGEAFGVIENLTISPEAIDGHFISSKMSIQKVWESGMGVAASRLHGELTSDISFHMERSGDSIKKVEFSGPLHLDNFLVAHPPVEVPRLQDRVILVDGIDVQAKCIWESSRLTCPEVPVVANQVPIAAKVEYKNHQVEIIFNTSELNISKITKEIRGFAIQGTGPTQGTVTIRPGKENFISVDANTKLKEMVIDKVKLGEIKSRVTYEYDHNLLAFTETHVQKGTAVADGEFGIDFHREVTNLWGRAEFSKVSGETMRDWGYGILGDRIQFTAGQWAGRLVFEGYPEIGKFTSTLDLTGQQAEWFGHVFDSQHVKAVARRDGITLEELAFRRGPWTLKGSIHVDPQFRMLGTLKASDVRLTDLNIPLPRPVLFKGTGDLTVDVSGSVEKPRVELDLVGRNVTTNSMTLGNVVGSYVFEGGDKTTYKFKADEKNKLTIEFEKQNFDFEFKFSNYDIYPIAQWFLPLKPVEANGFIVTSNGRLKGTTQPWSIRSIQVDTPELALRSRNSELVGEPFVISNQKNQLPIKLVFQGARTDAKLAGILDSNGSGDIRLSGTVALGWMTDWVSAVQSSQGRFEPDLNLNFRHWKIQSISGVGKVLDSEMDFEFLKEKFSEMSGEFVFTSRGISIQGARASVGGGKVRVAGEIGYPWIANSKIDLSSDFDEVKVRPFSDLFLNLNGKTRLTGSKRPFNLKGNVVVSRADVSGDRFSKEVIGREIESRFLPSEFQEGRRELVVLDLSVSIPSQFHIESPQFAGDLKGDVRLTGTDARPIILGNVLVTQGLLDIRGNGFNIESGSLRFEDPGRNDPFLNIASYSDFVQTVEQDQAKKEEKYRVFLNISGRWSFPKLEYSSDPPLSEEDITSLVVFGITSQEFGKRDGQGVLQKELVPQLFSRSRVSRDIEKSTGFKVRFSPDYSDTAKDGSLPRVAVSRRLGKKVEAEFKSNIDSESYREFNVQYKFNDSVSVKGLWEGRGEGESVSGQKPTEVFKNSFGGDIRYRIEFK